MGIFFTPKIQNFLRPWWRLPTWNLRVSGTTQAIGDLQQQGKHPLYKVLSVFFFRDTYVSEYNKHHKNRNTRQEPLHYVYEDIFGIDHSSVFLNSQNSKFNQDIVIYKWSILGYSELHSWIF